MTIVPGCGENGWVRMGHRFNSRREKGEGTYDWRCWHELFRSRVLNLESTNLEEHVSERFASNSREAVTYGVLEK